MPMFPDTQNQNDIERQGGAIATDPYMAGFLAGFAAAKANRNELDAGVLLASHTSWPFQDTLTPQSTFPPVNGWAPLSHSLSHAPCTSSLSQPQGSSTDCELHNPLAIELDVLPTITSSVVDNYPLDFNSSTLIADPPPLDNYGWFHTSDEAATSSASQPPLATESNGSLDGHLLPVPSLADSQHYGPALDESQLLASALGEGHNAPPPPPGSVTNGDQPWNAGNMHDSPTTEAGALTQTAAPWHTANTHDFPTTEAGALTQTAEPWHASTRTPREANLNGQISFPHASLPYVARRSQRSKSNVHPSQSGVTKRGAEGAIQVVFRAYGSSRAKFNEQSRIRTALTREVGACAYCRKKKLRCDQSSKEKFVPCGRCAMKATYLLPGPCCRVELIDIKLFRLGSTANPAILQQWILSKESEKGTLLLQDGTTAFGSPRRVYLTQDVNLTTFAVTISSFQPGPDDATAYVWTDAAGIKREYVLPPYYISDVAEAAENMRRYARTARREFTGALLVNSNPIVRKTFEEAERYYTATKSDLVAAALMFWSATRMIERFWLICGTDMLGMPPMEHNIGPCRRNPFVAAIPVTPVMDTQLDELAIRDVLVPLKAKLLRLLKAKVLAKKKEYWYEIYLASFIILHNGERVLDHVMDFARRFGVSPEPKSNDGASLSHAYYHACKTVLAYFHFASGGAAPLSLDWIGPAQDTSKMDQHQIAYLRDIKAEMLRQDAQLQLLKDASMYETEMYWCHQILFQGWKADMPHSGRLLEFTEKDFLVT